eukprot:scaffold203626_cov30-Tisochrysis_lutea.AAC.4
MQPRWSGREDDVGSIRDPWAIQPCLLALLGQLTALAALLPIGCPRIKASKYRAAAIVST